MIQPSSSSATASRTTNRGCTTYVVWLTTAPCSRSRCHPADRQPYRHRRQVCCDPAGTDGNSKLQRLPGIEYRVDQKAGAHAFQRESERMRVVAPVWTCKPHSVPFDTRSAKEVIEIEHTTRRHDAATGSAPISRFRHKGMPIVIGAVRRPLEEQPSKAARPAHCRTGVHSRRMLREHAEIDATRADSCAKWSTHTGSNDTGAHRQCTHPAAVVRPPWIGRTASGQSFVSSIFSVP